MKCYELLSKVDEVLTLTLASDKEYRAAHACKQCRSASAAWRAHPVALDVEVIKAPRGPISTIGGGCFASVLRADLARVLAPHLPRPLFGKVAVRKPTATDHPGRWVSCVPGEGRGIDVERGLYCCHVFCKLACGNSGNWIGWASGAVVRRTIGDRLAFFSNRLDIFVTDALVEKLDLKKKFPDLRYYEYDVVEEPLDGEVLPGDPGWDGVFRPKPPPEFPEGMEPRKGRCTIP